MALQKVNQAAIFNRLGWLWISRLESGRRPLRL